MYKLIYLLIFYILLMMNKSKIFLNMCGCFPSEFELAVSHSLSSLSYGLSNGRCHFHERPPCLLILCSMIGSYQTNVEWCDIRFTSDSEPVWWGWPDLQFQSLSKGSTLDLSTRLWSMDGSAHGHRTWDEWYGWCVWVVAGQYVCGPLYLKCGPSRKFVVCDTDTVDQTHRCF